MGFISEVIIQDILNYFFDKAKKFIQEKFQALNDKIYGINIFNIDAVRKLLHDAIQNSSKNDSLKNEEIKELLSDNYLSVFAWILEGTSFSNDLININNCENKNNQMDFMKTVQKYIYENRLNDENLLLFITYFNSKKELEKTNSIEELIKKNTPSVEWPTEVMNIKEFIRTYDCNKQVAPLELDFLFREKEIAQINDVLNNNDAIILKGKPGCGKTRLAIETAKRLSSKNLYEVFCIRELNDDSFTNFKIKIEENKKYLLIIDDVNLFDEKILTKLFQFTLENTKGCKFKFILTLRDSFYETISYFCSQHLSFQTLIIDNFNDEQITVFLDKTFGIKNQKYINQIIRICEGNPRLAYFAGFYAIKKNSLASIVNSTQLFHSYYGLFFDKIGLFKNENLLKTAGILSLFRQIDTTKLSNYTDILNLCNITESDFIESCHQLVKIEIAENRFSTIFKISEQCLENYFLYIFLLEKNISVFLKLLCYYLKKTLIL